MFTVTIIGGAAVILLSVVVDAHTTIKLIVAIVTVGGVTWLCKKITEKLNKDHSEIISFTGWCLMGGSIISILSLALRGLKPIGDAFVLIGKFIDKVIFWA